MDTELYNLANSVGLILKERQLVIVTAESCTGGLLAASITDVPGSSAYFERGFVVYSDIAKQEDLGVKVETLEKFGAVSEQVTEEMVDGALRRSHATVGVAVTGIAGPTGDSKNKPIGTVCFALAGLELPIKAVTMRFDGDRRSIRMQAVKFALKTLYMMYT